VIEVISVSLLLAWVVIIVLLIPQDARDELTDILTAPACIFGFHRWRVGAHGRPQYYVVRDREGVHTRCRRCDATVPA